MDGGCGDVNCIASDWRRHDSLFHKCRGDSPYIVIDIEQWNAGDEAKCL